MTHLIVWSVIDIVLLIAGLAIYLFIVGGQLTKIATMLEECVEIVRTIRGHADAIRPGVESINHTGGVVAGALPLLYGMAEGVVDGVTFEPDDHVDRAPARPASGRRRSRLHESVGYDPDAEALVSGGRR